MIPEYTDGEWAALLLFGIALVVAVGCFVWWWARE